MHIWLLQRPTPHVNYGENVAMVVAAYSAHMARTYASQVETPGERPAIWKDPATASCKSIGHASKAVKEGIVLVDYLAP